MSEPILDVRDLRFTYADSNEEAAPVVLDGVTLQIAPGSFVAVLGHNGSGKSTLAKHLNAIAAQRREGLCAGHGHRRRSPPFGHSPGGGHGVPKPR